MIKPTLPTPDRAPATLPRLALRPAEAAKALSIGSRLLWEMTNRGEIPCVRLGRCVAYPVHLLEAWLTERA